MELYDAKGSCQLCSTSTVQRRVDKAEYLSHARAHKVQGDNVKLSYPAGIRKASDSPSIFEIAEQESTGV